MLNSFSIHAFNADWFMHQVVSAIKRVALRVMEGGRDVSISKIIARYIRSLANCSVAARIADRSYIYDNSVETHRHSF